MYDPTTQGVIIFIIGISFLLLLLISFIVIIVYKYQQKQNIYFKEIEALNATHKNTLLQTQLEIQEQTFQNISREIHDNIGQKLTLAKLHLNMLNYSDVGKIFDQVNNSVNIITEAIAGLSDLSHSMSSEIISSHGLIKALEEEAMQLSKSGLYAVKFSVTGDSIFMKADTELVIFRIVQEVLNNIVKHAEATAIEIHLHYNSSFLIVEVGDDGKGFPTGTSKVGTGLQNIKTRANLLKGNLHINSSPGRGTKIKIEIPLYENDTTI